MALESRIISSTKSKDFEKKLRQKLKKRYSSEKLGKGNFIPLKNRKDADTYGIKIYGYEKVVIIFDRKNDKYTQIVQDIDGDEDIVFDDLAVLSPFSPIEEQTQKLTKEEWIDFLSGEKIPWKNQFCHHGIIFHPYVPHNVAFPVKGGEALKYPDNITKEDELLLTLYAKKINSEQQNEKNIKHTEDSDFNKNFFESLKIYSPNITNRVKSLKNIDFSL